MDFSTTPLTLVEIPAMTT